MNRISRLCVEYSLDELQSALKGTIRPTIRPWLNEYSEAELLVAIKQYHAPEYVSLREDLARQELEIDVETLCSWHTKSELTSALLDSDSEIARSFSKNTIATAIAHYDEICNKTRTL